MINAPALRLTPFSLLAVGIAMLFGCTAGQRETSQDESLLTRRTQATIREVMPSVVGVGAEYDFDLTTFNYAAGFEPDTSSPTGYRLMPGAHGIVRTHRFDEAQGAGVILCRNNDKTVILTSRHILYVPDTIDTFYKDSTGKSTDILYSRTIKTHAGYHVVDQNGLLKSAEVLKVDPRSDLGLLMVTSASLVGLPFPYRVGYGADVDWGDAALVFGSPKGIKQMTIGFISRSPYPGSFILDVAARAGYSGGPVMRIAGGGALELIGIVRAVPVTKLQYVAPPPDLVPGQHLSEEDIPNAKMWEQDLIEYGTAYAVNTERIGTFLTACRPLLDEKGILLPSQLMPED